MTNEEFNGCMLRMKNGDKDALKEVYVEYLKYIYTIVYGVVGNKEDAEDVTSEFFIKLWDISVDFEPKSDSHKGYIATIARNLGIDHMRKFHKEALVDEITDEDTPYISGNTQTPEEEVIEDVSLREALSMLNEGERQVISMKILSEMTFKEISDQTGVPMGTVTWRYKSAIEKLRRWGYESQES